MSKIVKMIPKERLSSIPLAPPDHPIYKRGVIVGEIRPSLPVGSMETHCRQVVERLVKESEEREKRRNTDIQGKPDEKPE